MLNPKFLDFFGDLWTCAYCRTSARCNSKRCTPSTLEKWFLITWEVLLTEITHFWFCVRRSQELTFILLCFASIWTLVLMIVFSLLLVFMVQHSLLTLLLASYLRAQKTKTDESISLHLHARIMFIWELLGNLSVWCLWQLVKTCCHGKALWCCINIFLGQKFYVFFGHGC